MTGIDLQTRLQVAKQASFISGDELRRQFEGDWHDIQHAEGVAKAETASQEAIHTFLRQIFPNEEIWGKGHESRPQATSFWVFDSLNGEENFAAGNEHFATTVAWVENGQPVVGVVSVPSKRALYWATKGGGAFYQDKSLHVRENSNPKDAIVLVGLGSGEARRKGVKAAEILQDRVRQIKIREAPALELCSIAAGTADAYLTYSVKPWDWIAARLILEEAGGKLTAADGSNMKLDTQAALGGNDTISDQLRAILA
ncbi:inositol monophosphatase family protein [Candidatus Berkelbacteria bacterium]|nr:inositol monophosphatase family protein [Candidatus Berkelbacteria bacterium]